MFLLGLVAAAPTLTSPAASSGAADYDFEYRSRITIDYEYGQEGGIVGVRGLIKPRWHSNCSFDRDVRLRYRTRDGSRREVWTKAVGEHGSWIINRTEPGTYKARIFREVRRYRLDGERRKVLCHGDASPELKMPRRTRR